MARTSDGTTRPPSGGHLMESSSGRDNPPSPVLLLRGSCQDVGRDNPPSLWWQPSLEDQPSWTLQTQPLLEKVDKIGRRMAISRACGQGDIRSPCLRNLETAISPWRGVAAPRTPLPHQKGKSSAVEGGTTRPLPFQEAWTARTSGGTTRPPLDGLEGDG